MGRVGQPPQAGFMTPAINRPDSFTVSGPITTNGVAVFTILAGENITLIDSRPTDPFFKEIADSGSLQAYPTQDSEGAPVTGQRLMSFGTTTPNTQFGRLSHQNGAYTTQWGNVTQNDITRHDNPIGVKANGNSVPAFVREGGVRFNANGQAGPAWVFGSGAFKTDWTEISGNLLQVGYGLSPSGSNNQFYVDVQQETKFPLDYLKFEQRWFAFSTRRLSHEAESCMEVYREGDVTDTAVIGWDSNGLINVSQLTAHSAKGGVPANVRVKTWYNQSGNGYHATVVDLVANPLRGPLIYSASSSSVARTIGANNVPALDFGGSQFMVADTGGSGDVDQPLWASVVGAFDDTTGTDYIFDGDDADRTFFFGDSGQIRWGSTLAPAGFNVRNTNDNLWVLMYNGANSEIKQSGTVEGTKNVGTGDNDGLTIGARYTEQQLLDGKIAEIVMFKGNASMAFTDMFISKYEANTNFYYDIF